MTWRVGVLCAIVGILLWSALTVHDQWVSRDAATLERVSERDRQIAKRDAMIAARNTRIRLLEVRDSLAKRREAAQAATHAQDLASLASAREALAKDQRESMPMPEVRALQVKNDIALASCENLSQTRADRIAVLEAQVADHKANTVDFKENRVAADSNRTDLVAVYHPPWYRRTLEWVATRSVPLIVGGVIGFVVAK